MYRTKAGFYEEDFRRKGIARLHVSYGRVKKKEADAASAAMHRLFRERRIRLIDMVRSGDATPHQIAGLIADDKSPGDALIAIVESWPTLKAAAADYVAWLASMSESGRRSAQTAHTAATQLEAFRAFAGDDTLVDQITATRVLEFQRKLMADGRAANTVTAYVWRVSGLFTWLVRREKRDAREAGRAPRVLDVPIDADEVSTRKTRRERALLKAEGERLIAATPAMMMFPVLCGLLAGLRIDEVVHLRPHYDIDLTLGLITVQEQPAWHPKNRKRRVVPIAPQLRPVTEFHLAHYASEQWMLPSPVTDDAPMTDKTLMRHFRRIVSDAELVTGRADPEGVVFHTLRHSFASWLVMEGVDLFTVSQLLGNSLKQVEGTYAHLAPDFRQRAVDRLGSLLAVPALESGEPSEQEPAGAI